MNGNKSSSEFPFWVVATSFFSTKNEPLFAFSKTQDHLLRELSSGIYIERELFELLIVITTMTIYLRVESSKQVVSGGWKYHGSPLFLVY